MGSRTETSAAGDAARRRLGLELQGVVQGVGYRPFVFRLATELGLSGWVRNDSAGLQIEVEGEARALQRFADRLLREAPRQARVVAQAQRWLSVEGDTAFTIRNSDPATTLKTALIVPDLVLCGACRAEIMTAGDRRCGYPFTNCTDCGPRFSIIAALPYDRGKTTMARFAMCAACQGEYDAPGDRRFHAQPNACARCGPRLALWAPDGRALALGPAALRSAAAALLAGAVLALKGLGGFQLLVSATDEQAVQTLRRRKRRPHQPFAVMVRDLQAAASLVSLSAAAAEVLASAAGPIVLLPRRPAAPLAAAVAPESHRLGLLLPTTPLHALLLAALPGPVVATSGNRSQEPLCIDEREALARLGDLADVFLVHDRPVARPVDDSVVWLTGDTPRLLRRARGFAPLPLRHSRALPALLAVGGQLKSTVALSAGAQLLISQHLGDLGTLESQGAFLRAATDLMRLYETCPRAIAHDLHPDYVSTQWAHRVAAGEQAQARTETARLAGLPLIGVQHHHAHLAACLADNAAEGPALGVIFDGSGYGTDGTIWGGEFLLGDARGYRRFAHLRHFPLPGGEASIREPWRVARALLWTAGGSAALAAAGDLPGLRDASAVEARVLLQMLERGINTPLTSSAGRLFDGVAALLGRPGRVSYEAQGAIALEALADPREAGCYPLPLRAGPSAASPLLLDWQPLLEGLLADLRRGLPLPRLAARFHQTLAAAIVAVAERSGQARVALSGGCFQNTALVERTTRALGAAGFEVLLHRQLPPNDGGLSVGQLLVAAARLEQPDPLDARPCAAGAH
ncbi:MAG: carbamoyltransferase HypF [Proteobacteria bacterium]|nr:carbamoyltransferase HypF [Pseudomonadota bacterium]